MQVRVTRVGRYIHKRSSRQSRQPNTPNVGKQNHVALVLAGSAEVIEPHREKAVQRGDILLRTSGTMVQVREDQRVHLDAHRLSHSATTSNEAAARPQRRRAGEQRVEWCRIDGTWRAPFDRTGCGAHQRDAAGYFSADLRVVLARVFFGPAFRVAVVLAPRVRVAACFGSPPPRPAPLFTDLRPGFSAGASTLFFGSVPVSLWRLPRPRFIWPPLRTVCHRLNAGVKRFRSYRAFRASECRYGRPRWPAWRSRDRRGRSPRGSTGCRPPSRPRLFRTR
jgi:hypothetical protein